MGLYVPVYVSGDSLKKKGGEADWEEEGGGGEAKGRGEQGVKKGTVKFVPPCSWEKGFCLAFPCAVWL